MIYKRKFSPEFEKDFSKIKKKDLIMFSRICKKIKEVLEKPELCKPLKYNLKGLRRFHVGSHVIIFDMKEDMVEFLVIEHHDDAYKR